MYFAKISATRLAVYLGISAEILVCGSFAAFGGFGPCGPTNGFSGIVLMFHLPAFWLVDKTLTEASEFLFVPIAFVSGAATFTAIFWIMIFLGRKFCSKDSTSKP